MAYGRKRTFRKRKPRRGKTFQRRRARRVGRNRRAVSGHARNIQSATKAPMSRVVMFEDTRSFIVSDDALNAIGQAIPPQKIIQLNSPYNMFPTATAVPAGSQGKWTPSDFGSKGIGLPAVSTWVTNADGTGPGQYRMASCHSTEVVVTCIPINEDAGVDKKAAQAVTKLHCRKVTKLSDATDLFGVAPSSTFNVDWLARQPYTRSQDMYRAQVNKGATIKTSYSFKRLNAGPARSNLNHFFADKSPTEMDFLCISIMPTNPVYGTAGTAPTDPLQERNGDYRVVITVKSIVQLSEPNTNGTHWGEGDGNTFQRLKRKAGEMLGGGGADEDA